MAKRKVVIGDGAQLDLVDWLAEKDRGSVVSKKCCTCKTEKPVDMFSRNKSAKDGLQERCKSCVARHRKANVGAIRARKADYYKANDEKIRARVAEYYKANAEAIKAYRAEYYKANVEAVKAQQAEYCKANAEAIKARSAEYRKVNAVGVLVSAAPRRNAVTISREWVASAEAKTHCHLTGLPFDQDRRGKSKAPLGKSLDRIDNALGYTDDNTMVCSYWANAAKGEASDAEFVALCRMVLDYRRRRVKIGKPLMSEAERLEKVRELVSGAKKRAKKSGRAFSLDLEWARQAAKQTHCAISGMPFAAWKIEGRHGNDGDNISLDQIDPGKGYTPGNVQLVRQRFNRLKGELSMSELYSMCEAVVDTWDAKQKAKAA